MYIYPTTTVLKDIEIVRLITVSQDLACRLVFPVRPLLYRPVEGNGAGAGAIIHAAATVPALIRVQYQRRFLSLGIRNIDIHLADFHAVIAAVAGILVKYNGPARCGDIG
jgi:hypothetical protein